MSPHPWAEAERPLLRRCAEQPGGVDADAIFARLDAADDDIHVGARALTLWVTADPAAVAPVADRLGPLLDAEAEEVEDRLGGDKGVSGWWESSHRPGEETRNAPTGRCNPRWVGWRRSQAVAPLGRANS